MRLTTEYGYLIKLLRAYPFKREIERREKEIENPIGKTNDDPNWWIKAKNKPSDPMVLRIMEAKELDPELCKYRRWKRVISEVVSETPQDEWRLIRDSFVEHRISVEGAAQIYAGVGKTKGYSSIVRPFFERLEAKNDKIIASDRVKINFSIENAEK